MVELPNWLYSFWISKTRCNFSKNPGQRLVPALHQCGSRGCVQRNAAGILFFKYCLPWNAVLCVKEYEPHCHHRDRVFRSPKVTKKLAHADLYQHVCFQHTARVHHIAEAAMSAQPFANGHNKTLGV